MSYHWTNLPPERVALLGAHGGESVVAVRPSVVRALKGNGNTAILLCQFLYWAFRTKDQDGWFYNTQVELEQQTGLSVDVQQTARAQLIKLGLIEEQRRGLPAKLYYRVNLAKVAELIIDAHRPKVSGGSPNKITGTSESGRYRESGTFSDENPENATESGVTDSEVPADKSGATSESRIGGSSKQDSGNLRYIKDSNTDTPTDIPTDTQAAAATETPQPDAEAWADPQAHQLLRLKLNHKNPAAAGKLEECLLEKPARSAWRELTLDQVRHAIDQADEIYRSGKKTFTSALIQKLDAAAKPQKPPPPQETEGEKPKTPEERARASAEAQKRFEESRNAAREARRGG